ncbi:hypothetical protein ABIA33_002787 [Streptacidiphilus sp. MAP12-16]|uniref:three-helix bundle dimerization domain-containing protein n=1 Tax=Streptacidiphilus sp. MAP12-16 TaxID=3156300 RepID=UPI0035182539
MSLDLHEDEAVRHIADRLKAAYQDRHAPERVEAAVAAALDHFQDTRIRDFVPVLVERRARAALDTELIPVNGHPSP